MSVHVSLIPVLGRTNTTVRKVAGLGRLAVGLNAATLVERDLAVVACAAGSRAVLDLCAGELALYVCGVDAGFDGCGREVLVFVWLLLFVLGEGGSSGAGDEGWKDILESPCSWPLTAALLFKSFSACLAMSATFVFLYSADMMCDVVMSFGWFENACSVSE